MSNPSLTIHRGTHQIGGIAAELCAGDERIVIDLGANLPGTEAAISDEELIGRVFDGRPCDAVLFTHLHGDHAGLYRHIPTGTRTFIGPTAKRIMKIVAKYVDKDSLPLIEAMETYKRGRPLEGFRNMRIIPLSVDHSAPDSSMLYIEAAGKRILFTGDFRAHGIANERGQLWRVLEKYVPRGIDLLVTEGTLLSRTEETRANPVRTEQELGERAQEMFSEHKYNFVLVSSTNLDSIMEFYHAVPKGKFFVCDTYQARVMLAAMEAAGRKYPQYRAGHTIYLIGWLDTKIVGRLIERGKELGVLFGRTSFEEMRLRGFVLLARSNRYSGINIFEKALKEFRDEAFLTYSMWTGYLSGERCEDSDLIRFIGDTPYEVLHTSGHAYPEDIARVIQMTEPRLIVPMHTERAEEFPFMRPFVPWADRARVLNDGEILKV